MEAGAKSEGLELNITAIKHLRCLIHQHHYKSKKAIQTSHGRIKRLNKKISKTNNKWHISQSGRLGIIAEQWDEELEEEIVEMEEGKLKEDIKNIMIFLEQSMKRKRKTLVKGSAKQDSGRKRPRTLPMGRGDSDGSALTNESQTSVFDHIQGGIEVKADRTSRSAQ